ncbi:MAG TPA: hypothetical protein VKE69_01045 [Planctomycetota bacterium]|nr:hypothetical protein [Planctomycetota bacterium]
MNERHENCPVCWLEEFLSNNWRAIVASGALAFFVFATAVLAPRLAREQTSEMARVRAELERIASGLERFAPAPPASAPAGSEPIR